MTLQQADLTWESVQGFYGCLEPRESERWSEVEPSSGPSSSGHRIIVVASLETFATRDEGSEPCWVQKPPGESYKPFPDPVPLLASEDGVKASVNVR